MSVKPPQSKKLTLAGPVGSLEAILEVPADSEPVGAVVVCHPHPQYGGTMHNKVAHTLARSFVRMGFAALRFNFRGTEGSEGEYDEGNGELDDARAAQTMLELAADGFAQALDSHRLRQTRYAFDQNEAAEAAKIRGRADAYRALANTAEGPILHTEPGCRDNLPTWLAGP